MSLAQRAFTALQEGKAQFGAYHYHDKGASEIMETSGFADELKQMTADQAGQVLLELAAMDDTWNLVQDLIHSLDEWEHFDEMLALHDDLEEYY